MDAPPPVAIQEWQKEMGRYKMSAKKNCSHT